MCCYCCLSTLKPKCIEVLALICNILEISFLVWGIIKIPWSDITLARKIIFWIPCGLIVLTFLILLTLMCLRCSKKINTSKNCFAECLCVTMIVFDIVSEILIVISEILIINKMRDRNGNNDDHWYDYYERSNYRNSQYSDSQWAAATISVSVVELFLIIHCCCVTFLFKLIKAKTNKTYLDYLETKSQDNANNKTVEILNSPQNQTTTKLNFIGYDQNGHPIYSGNSQYSIKNQNINNI